MGNQNQQSTNQDTNRKYDRQTPGSDQQQVRRGTSENDRNEARQDSGSSAEDIEDTGTSSAEDIEQAGGAKRNRQQ